MDILYTEDQQKMAQLRFVNGVTPATFRSACQALNLLENDRHWDVCINDSSNTSHPNQIRALFAIILTTGSPSSPTEFWEKYKSHLAEDLVHRIRRISLPHNFCNLVTSKEELAEKVFPNIQINYKNHDWLSERAVLAAKNKDFCELNNIIQSNIKSEAVTYKSVDTVVEADEAVNYPTVFLNSLDLPGIPPHVLQLNIGVPIIMLRNINQPKLCNGTRLAVKIFISNVIEAAILTGPLKGEDVLIPRIPMIPTDMPFQFKRLQFPIRLAFAKTINKAQGQSLELCGLDLYTDCFSHGQ
ncbi:uncharacterized protein [Procambarus clarkii]|uniref:uncharacterized protein n=1 Tax=Procambarus clarkii TaxID=6728 RepID=UPI00374443CC